MSTEQTPNLGGKAVDPTTLVNLKKEDPWRDARFFTFGESNSENVTAIPEGTTVNGMFFGTRQSRAGKKSTYAAMKDDAGVMYRLFSQTVLHNRLLDLEEEVGRKKIEENGILVSISRGELKTSDSGSEYYEFEVLAQIPKH